MIAKQRFSYLLDDQYAVFKHYLLNIYHEYVHAKNWVEVLYLEEKINAIQTKDLLEEIEWMYEDMIEHFQE